MVKQNSTGLLGRALAIGSKATAHYVTVTYIIPIGAPIVTIALGYFSGLPWFWIWLGALAAFAFIFNGLLRFDEWTLGRRVEDKLSFSSVIVGRSIKGDGITIGVRIHSAATFPIEFHVAEMRTRLADKVPQKMYQNGQKHIVPPNGIGWHHDNVIQITDPPRPGTIEGYIEFEIEYGRPGSLKYNLIGKKQVVASFNDDGLFTHSAWNDAT